MSEVSNDNDDRAALKSITDADLTAYVAGGLSRRRRAEIEGYLACNPDLAARIMGAMHKQGDAKPAQRARRSPMLAIAAAVGGVFIAATAWSTETLERWGSPFTAPEFVEDALMSRRASLVRVDMKSQFENTDFDASEIGQVLQMNLPAFPAAWRIIDAQVFPSEEGPSVSLVLNDDGDTHPIYLFAVRANTIASKRPTITREKGEYVAYWEMNGTAYALSGGLTRSEIEANAALLAGSGGA